MKASEIAGKAVDVGSVSKAAQPAAEAAAQAAKNTDTGIRASELEESKAFLVNVIVDDSGSMAGMEATVTMALGRLVDELSEAAEDSDADILLQIWFLNQGLMQAYIHVDEARCIDESNYVCDGWTPLFTITEQVLGTMVNKVGELSASGRTAQSFTAIISDGGASDGGEDDQFGVGGINNDVAPGKTQTVAQLIKGLTSTKQHIVCGVSIGSAADSWFHSVNVPSKWILHPTKDTYAFEEAIRQVSRASRSASQGAGAFQSVAQEGFE